MSGKERQRKRYEVPLEVTLDILHRSAWSSSTENARNMCLVNKAAYKECWPALHRTVAIRDASQLQEYAQGILSLKENESAEQIKQRRSALQALYINNSPHDAASLSKPATYLVVILANSPNLKMCHFEEHWSSTSPWVRKTKVKASRLFEQPLRLLSSFPALFGTMTDDGTNTVFARLPPRDQRKPEQWRHLVPKVTELTLSAHTISKDFSHSHNIEFHDWFCEWNSYYPVSNELHLLSNFSSFDNLTHLHLYFANFDNLDNSTLLFVWNLPKLTHLRLSRPSSRYVNRDNIEEMPGEMQRLSDLSLALVRLLSRAIFAPIQSIIVQLDSDFDKRVLKELIKVQDHYRKDKLHIIGGDEGDTPGYGIPFDGSDGGLEVSEADQEASSSSMPAQGFSIAGTMKDTDAKCEKVAVRQFAKRAAGGEGIWMRDCMTLW